MSDVANVYPTQKRIVSKAHFHNILAHLVQTVKMLGQIFVKNINFGNCETVKILREHWLWLQVIYNNLPYLYYSQVLPNLWILSIIMMISPYCWKKMDHVYMKFNSILEIDIVYNHHLFTQFHVSNPCIQNLLIDSRHLNIWRTHLLFKINAFCRFFNIVHQI